MTKVQSLTKTFENDRDVYGFSNDLTVNVDYNPEDGSIDNLEVYSYHARKEVLTELTCLFQTVPELVNLIDNINWPEIYADQMAEMEKEVYDEQ